MGQLHHIATGADPEIAPVTIPDWWCTTCGRGEATEIDPDTRLCSDCRYMQDGQHRRVAVRAASASPVRDGIECGLEQVESAQRLLVDVQGETEWLIEGADPALSWRLTSSVDRLSEVGAALLAAHSALSLARLAAGEAP